MMSHLHVLWNETSVDDDDGGKGDADVDAAFRMVVLNAWCCL